MKSTLLFVCFAFAVTTASLLPKDVLPKIVASNEIIERALQQATVCTTKDRNVGQSCTAAAGDSNGNCLEGLVCRSGACAYGGPGTDCTNDDQCDGYGSDACINNKCDFKRIAEEACQTNQQCLSSQCVNNTCIGKPVGAACTNSDCARGLYCDPSLVCAEALPVGAQCGTAAFALLSRTGGTNDYLAMCYHSFCDVGFNGAVPGGVCKKFLNSPVGGACGSPFVCAAGLRCNGANGQFGTCETEAGYACDNVQECSSFSSECVCRNATAGVCQSNCNSELKSAVDCVIDRNCTILGASSFGLPNVCVSPCNDLFVSAVCCQASSRTNIYTPPAIKKECPSAATNLVIATLFVAIMALISSFVF